MKARKRTLPSGNVSWVFEYVDREGKRRSPSFSTKRAADDAIARITEELRHGIHTPDAASITVAQAGDLWITAIERRQRETTTVKQYQQHISGHIMPLIGGRKLSKLTTPLIAAFADELAKSRSLPMAKKVLTSLKSLLSEAQRRGYIAQNVALPVKIEISSRFIEPARIPTKGDCQSMLENVSKLAPRWRPLIVIAMLAGLRASELRALTWDALDLTSRTLEVRQRADAFQKIGPPKSQAGRRKVPLSPMCVNTLKEWRLRCPKGDLNLVFPNTAGSLMQIPDILRLCWYPLLKSCGLLDLDGVDKKGEPRFKPRYEFHHLRHVAASLWIAEGATPKRIQVAMGHSSIRVTFDIYGHLWTDADADQAMVAGAEKRLFS